MRVKKIIALLSVLTVILFSSCRSTKKPCPAYDMVKTATIVLK